MCIHIYTFFPLLNLWFLCSLNHLISVSVKAGKRWVWGLQVYNHTQWLFIFLFIWGADVERGRKDKRGICTSTVTCSSDQIAVSVKRVLTKNSVSRWPVRNGGSRLLPLVHIPSLGLCLSSVNFVSLVRLWCCNQSYCPVVTSPLLCLSLTEN